MAEPSADELKALAEVADADAALGCGRASAAYYLAGYAVECGLKAIIALSFRASVIPDRRFVESVYTHDLNRLVAVAGLAAEVKERARVSDEFRLNWALAAAWSEASRYEVIDSFRATSLVQAIGHPTAGVLPWLKAHW